VCVCVGKPGVGGLDMRQWWRLDTGTEGQKVLAGETLG